MTAGRAHVERALADAAPVPFWLDDPAAPDACAPPTQEIECDLAVVGGGFTGLWAALFAKEHDPSADVVLLEAETIGSGASGRNGGFCSTSLTHGLSNGLNHFPAELPTLERLGAENLDAIERTIVAHGIDCDFERSGRLAVATEGWQLADLPSACEVGRRYGHDVEFLERDRLREEVDSPTYLGGLWIRNETALINPARLAWGLKEACLRCGVRIFEHTPVVSLAEKRSVELATPYAPIRARRVVLGTNAFAPLLRRVRPFVLPVYDYTLMTEPLSPDRLAAVGWRRRQGIADGGNQFHYYRLTSDNRILWGGYDAIYHYRNRVRPDLERRPETFTKLAEHFFATFPQLRDAAFTHAWGGVIDTCSRFCAFFGTASRGRVAYAVGYTGLGVAATRFGARVCLDLLSGERTELTELRLVRTKPLPYPPEPLRFGLVQLTRWSLARADAGGGRRNVWLRTLDRLGLGFDS